MAKISFDELQGAIVDEIKKTLKDSGKTEGEVDTWQYCEKLTDRIRAVFDMAENRELPADADDLSFVELHFGEIVTTMIFEITCTDAELDWYERVHPESAAERYRHAVHSAIIKICFNARKSAEIKKALMKMVDSGEMAALLKG